MYDDYSALNKNETFSNFLLADALVQDKSTCGRVETISLH